ncbi:triose-phosphate isomerase [Buchnera aphidicola (Kurisakia onigurumii)]|uniref:triose-phosphate isomerase n=1 Tax=Buchnera aphidicola TaxID=9 RepID=UPI0031B6FA1D
MKKKNIIANWKLNGNKHSIISFLSQLNRHLTVKESNILDISIAFPIVYLDMAHQIISDFDFKISLCAQNVNYNTVGAFTGEISVYMLKDIGVKHVIIGHSETRKNHKETEKNILKKFIEIKKSNLIPILCIGETLKQKESGKTELIIKKQLSTILNSLGNESFDNTIIAYEPIWSIGTGKNASTSEIKKINNFIRNHITSFNESNIIDFLIFYGGSVNEKNVEYLSKKKYIDGLLIGSSSLNSDEFINIIKIITNN